MSDRELLELAAKAAGYRPDGNFGRGLLVVMKVGQPDQCAFPFDPLNDDGDALRLAVKLDIFATPVFFHYRSLERFGRQDADDVTATRRAIVRAAAEIARAAA